MTIPFINVVVHEPDVALTDWLLALECLVFCWLLLRRSNDALRNGAMACFAALCLASAIGGAYHAFFPLKTTTTAGWATWLLTLLSLGGASASLLFSALASRVPRRMTVIVASCTVLSLGYATYVAFVDARFVVAIAFYGLALLAFLAHVAERFMRRRERWAIFGVVGITVTIVASIMQQALVSLPALGINHNGLYHILQAFALFFLFRALRENR
jgi:hypothetical protein